MRISCKHILPACAAVLVAAAFALMCIYAPAAYASNDYTSTQVDGAVADLISHYGLSNTDVRSAAFVASQRSDIYEIRYFLNPSVSVNSNGSVTVSGAMYGRYFSSSGVNYSSGARYFTVNSDSVVIEITTGTARSYTYTDTDGRYIIGLSYPSAGADDPIESIKRALVNDRVGSGSYGFAGSSPVLDVDTPADTYYNNYVKSVVDDNLGTTTTTTTTTTTIATTTTTGSTLPPYPYETSPPFTLPADWTADYSETTPVPSLPPVGTADISGYDDQISDAESQLLPGIAFWFILLGDFLLSVPGIIISALVFCILIYLTITLLYHKGGD